VATGVLAPFNEDTYFYNDSSVTNGALAGDSTILCNFARGMWDITMTPMFAYTSAAVGTLNISGYGITDPSGIQFNFLQYFFHATSTPNFGTVLKFSVLFQRDGFALARTRGTTIAGESRSLGCGIYAKRLL
jgi:hypothetical protein